MREAIGRLTAAVILTALAGAGHATTLKLQPGEDTSKDVFVYAFSIPGTLGIPTPPNTSNLDTANIPSTAVVPFGAFLGASNTVPFRMDPSDASEPLRSHDTKTLLQFDVGSLGVGASRVRSAYIDLHAVPGLPPFDNATPDNPVNLVMKRVLTPWEEQTVTWDTRPEVGDVAAGFALTGAPQTVRFDVTELLKGWLNDPASNLGVEVSQLGLAAIPQGDGMKDRFAAGLFASSASADPSMRPSLEVAPVPLPAPAMLLLGGIAVLGGVRGFRRAA